ncbi:M24 family metallopeptidase [Clostridium paraputrificum]|uniref:M24 family metallopeptidase n=1 Tax=Clostridium TaxID=1485 RepID=UPI003D34264B
MKTNRVNRVIEEMKNQNLEQILVSAPPAIFYLTGKWFHPGERMITLLLKSNGEHKLIVNKLFPITEDLGVDLVWYEDTDKPVEILSGYINKDEKLGIDKTWPAHFLISLMDINAAKAFVNASPIIDRLRMIKDDEERELMRISSQKNDRVIERLISELEEGKTEKYYADRVKELYEEEGVYEFSFSPIVAFSPNGADPHHGTDNTKLNKGQSVVIDIGGVYNSYCSDMTRTVFFGEEPSEEDRRVYEIVKNANLNAIAKVKPGVKFSDIDKAARDYIEEQGYGEYFTHRTGHSIGIEDHDFGDVSSVNDDVIEEGMIFSIEPGIYLPGKIGVRIEDLVMVTADGCEVLNSVSKEVTVIK